MVLEELVSTIEELQSRIRRHRLELEGSEASTRVSLINPLLTALDWDVGNPAYVSVERHLREGGKADYLLRGRSGRPIILVEAKKLGYQLKGAVRQASDYCLGSSIPYFIVTDGRQWQLHKCVSTTTYLITEFDIADSARQASVQALAFWQPTVRQGFIPTISENDNNNSHTTSEPSSKPLSVAPSSSEWRPITSMYTRSTAPSRLRYPDEQIHIVSGWNDLAESLVRWLNTGDYLEDLQFPIRNAKNNRVVATRGMSFGGTVGGGRWMKVGSLNFRVPADRGELGTNLSLIVRAAGFTPDEFSVQFTNE